MELDLNVNNIPEKLQHKDHVFMYGLHVNLVVDSLTTIIANTESVKLNLKDVQTDSLFVRGNRYDMSLDSCRLRSLDIQGNGLSFHAKNSRLRISI